MDLKKEALVLLLDSIDLEKLAIGSLHLAEKAALEASAKSATPVDDAIEAVAFPALNPAIEGLIKSAIADLKAKILA